MRRLLVFSLSHHLILTATGSTAIDEVLAERDELLRENQSLRQENQEMGELLKEYERGLESTTELIRDHAVSNSRSDSIF
jgi:hypothetical protein